jgi:hypothetical protein
VLVCRVGVVFSDRSNELIPLQNRGLQTNSPRSFPVCVCRNIVDSYWLESRGRKIAWMSLLKEVEERSALHVQMLAK